MKAPGQLWGNGRLDRRKLPGKVLFGRVYEDALIDLEAHDQADHVFCIASAGCTALRLAAHHRVTAVDINPAQLAYARRRALGGAMMEGSIERILGIARSALFLIGWNTSRLEEFCALENPLEQSAFWRANLDTLRFRSVTKALLSSPVLSMAYRPELVAAIPAGFGEVIRGRLARCWSLHPNRSNPYIRALLLGELDRAHRAPAKKPISFVHAEAAEYLESCRPHSIDGFSISNILDGAPAAYRRRLFAAIARAGSAKSQVVMRSFAPPPKVEPPGFVNFASADRCPIWGQVEIRHARELL